MSIRISPFLLPEKRIEKVLLVYLLDHFLYLFLFTVILATFADTQQSIHFMTLVQVRKISVHYLQSGKFNLAASFHALNIQTSSDLSTFQAFYFQ